MKNVTTIFAVLAITAIGFFMLGGNVTAGKPTATKPERPSVNDVATNTRKGAEGAADTVSTFTPDTWKMIILGVVAAVIMFAWFHYPKFKFFVLGLGVMLVVVLAMKG